MTWRDRWWFLAGMYFALAVTGWRQLVHIKAAKRHAVAGHFDG